MLTQDEFLMKVDMYRFDQKRQESVDQLKQFRQTQEGERLAIETEQRHKARLARLLAQGLAERRNWIQEHPGQDNPFLWIEYSKNGKLLPMSKSLHV